MNTDAAKRANARIWDFVHARANARLRPGTGSYSTPFRGGLFGKTKSSDVARLTVRRRVDVLWLGANPAVRSSLENILNRGAGLGDFPSFERQIQSGFFGSCKWANGVPTADWNPIETPRGGWRIYQRLLVTISRLEHVAMANVIPWGSQDAKTFLRKLHARDPALLRRVLEFADDLNVEIVETLKPKLLVVPLSLARQRELDAIAPIGVSLSKTTDVSRHEVLLPEGRFKFFTGVCQRGRYAVPTVFLRHPASLRLSVQSRVRLVSRVGEIVKRFQMSGEAG